jgi:hypothetical protein
MQVETHSPRVPPRGQSLHGQTSDYLPHETVTGERPLGSQSMVRPVLGVISLMWMCALVGPTLVAVGIAGAIWGVSAAIVAAIGLLLLLAVAVHLFRGSDRVVMWSTPQVSARGKREMSRVLLVASQASIGPQLMREIRFRVRKPSTEIFVLCPVLDTPVEHWAGGSDADRATAREFLHSLLDQLNATGIEASGSVGENEPLVAIEDALRRFPADEILIATHPFDELGWLEHGIVAKIRARSDLPITHIMPAHPRYG